MRPNRFPLRWNSPSTQWVTTHSPNTGEPLAEVQYLAPGERILMERLASGQRALETTAPHARASWLRGLAGKIRAEKEALAMLIATEGGKPLKDARVEAERAASTFELCAEETLRLGGEVLPMGRTPASEGRLSFTFRVPIGPVLALSAFNHPLNLLAHQVGTALAAGCPVGFKPAPGTPACGEWLADALDAVGVPPGVAQVFHADVPEIEALLADPFFRYVSFIGSAKVGWGIRAKLAPGTRLALEHGGQAPALVWDDADLDAAAKALCKGAFYHAGQVCISTQRIYVHQDAWKPFLEKLKTEARKLVVGDARQEATDVGPLIRAGEKQRVQEWIDEAVAAGARAELRDAAELPGHLLGPAILSNVPSGCRLWREEVFGPVVAVNPFGDVEDVYAELSASEFPFEAAVFTRSLPRALEAVKRMDAMTVVVNDHTAYRVDWMPFGGHRRAGLGMGGVRWAVEEMTRLKQAVVNGA